MTKTRVAVSSGGASPEIEAPRERAAPTSERLADRAAAAIARLDAALKAEASATLVLERWCMENGLADPPCVRLERVATAGGRPSPQIRARLALRAGETLRYRRVRLLCGPFALSEAENWYVPERLTPSMNHVLETTDIAFGLVVRALDFDRVTLAAEILWRPDPDACSGSEPPLQLFRHRALLLRKDRTPFSALVETYLRGILGGSAPAG